MHIEWSSEKDKKAVLRLAQQNRVTARRMNAIKASKNFRDIEHPSTGRAHFLKNDLAGYFAIDLEGKTRPARLICQPAGDCRQDEQGFYIKETVTEFIVIKIEKDYHKK